MGIGTGSGNSSGSCSGSGIGCGRGSGSGSGSGSKQVVMVARQAGGNCAKTHATKLQLVLLHPVSG